MTRDEFIAHAAVHRGCHKGLCPRESTRVAYYNDGDRKNAVQMLSCDYHGGATVFELPDAEARRDHNFLHRDYYDSYDPPRH